MPVLSRYVARFCLPTLWCVLASVSTNVHAAPDTGPAAPSTEAITKLLQDKGLLNQAVSPPPEDGLDRLRERATDMVLTAMNFLGVPYRRGGNSEDAGFDCSGFTRHVFESSLGLVLPRRADEQARSPDLIKIGKDELRPGDLVFFNTLKRTFSHVGIYIGEGKFIHAPRSGQEVRIEDMRFEYWSKRFTGARRAPSSTDPNAPTH